MVSREPDLVAQKAKCIRQVAFLNCNAGAQGGGLSVGLGRGQEPVQKLLRFGPLPFVVRQNCIGEKSLLIPGAVLPKSADFEANLFALDLGISFTAAAGTPFAFKLSTILKDREASAESVFRTQGRGFLFQLRKIHR